LIYDVQVRKFNRKKNKKLLTFILNSSLEIKEKEDDDDDEN